MGLNSAVWHKASRSGHNGGNCVEVAGVPGTVAVRDSKDPAGPKLLVGRAAFQRFAGVVKSI